jgi:hypothetical protein
MAKTPAWTRKEGKNPKGGLNAKGRASYKGGTLKAPVKSGDNPRRASFLARMGGLPGPERKPNYFYHYKHGVLVQRLMLRKKQQQYLREIKVSNDYSRQYG